MKKDIEIKEFEGLSLVVTYTFNDIYKSNDWVAFLLNESSFDLNTVLIMSKGFDRERETAIMRHKIDVLPAGSFAKIELLQEDVLELNNEFSLSFFVENNLFEKKFFVPKSTVKEGKLRMIKAMNMRGIAFK
ncbi:hypothetical protein [Namhaeicola litoreus]|uniref:Phenylalanyl-tRNA synthetase subunit alpha n=1 Tax=Namhaeicola litoreus TaxID=1052145 RepID=A0ABW3XYX6_9FLAO